MMSSTDLRETLDSVASLLAATLYQGNPNRNHQLWNIVSTERYMFGDFVDHIYPIELEIKDTTDIDMSASYLDIHLEIDSERWLRTKLYDKRDDYNFPIVNFPFICSKMQEREIKGSG
jgi:hypothetical protein